jgi:hypothetical protein
MVNKICKVCGTSDNIQPKTRYCYSCYRENEKKVYQKNRIKRLAKVKEYDLANKDIDKEYHKSYYLKNKEKINKYNNEYKKHKYDTDPLYRLKHNTRVHIKKCIMKQGYTKNSKTYDILGCTYDEFKIYIESKFEDWMTWDNYGKYKKNKYNLGWDIDHIIPTSTATNESELYKLFHYTNLQPLCSKVNRDEKKNNMK